MISAERLALLRAFALERGALYFPITTRSRGAVPIFADDIRSAGADDEELVRHVLERIGGADQLTDAWRAAYSSGQNHTSTESQ